MELEWIDTEKVVKITANEKLSVNDAARSLSIATCWLCNLQHFLRFLEDTQKMEQEGNLTEGGRRFATMVKHMYGYKEEKPTEIPDSILRAFENGKEKG